MQLKRSWSESPIFRKWSTKAEERTFLPGSRAPRLKDKYPQPVSLLCAHLASRVLASGCSGTLFSSSPFHIGCRQLRDSFRFVRERRESYAEGHRLGLTAPRMLRGKCAVLS